MYWFKWFNKFGTLSDVIYYKSEEGCFTIKKDNCTLGDFVYIYYGHHSNTNPRMENVKIIDGVLKASNIKFTNIVRLSKKDYVKEKQRLEEIELQEKINKEKEEIEKGKSKLIEDISNILSINQNVAIVTKASIYTDLLKRTFNTLNRKTYKKDNEGHYKIGNVYIDSSTLGVVFVDPNSDEVERSMRVYMEMLLKYNTNVTEEHFLKIKEILDDPTKIS